MWVWIGNELTQSHFHHSHRCILVLFLVCARPKLQFKFTFHIYGYYKSFGLAILNDGYHHYSYYYYYYTTYLRLMAHGFWANILLCHSSWLLTASWCFLNRSGTISNFSAVIAMCVDVCVWVSYRTPWATEYRMPAAIHRPLNFQKLAARVDKIVNAFRHFLPSYCYASWQQKNQIFSQLCWHSQSTKL